MVFDTSSNQNAELKTSLDLNEKLLEPKLLVDSLSKEADSADIVVTSSKTSSRFPSGYLLIACVSACCSMAINTVHFMVANMLEHELKTFVNESYQSHYHETMSEEGILTMWGFIVGAPMVFAIFGAASVKYFAEQFGRKVSMFLIHNVMVIASCLFCFLAKPFNMFELFIAGRLVFGVGYGFSLALAGIYTTECSPPNFRCLVGSFSGMMCGIWFILFGVLCLPAVLGNEDTWPYIFLVGIILAILSMISGFFLPESPKFTYIVKGEKTKAIRHIQQLHGPAADIHLILKSYDEETKQTAQSGSISATSIKNIFKRPHLRKGLSVGIAAILIRAFCGYEIFVTHGTGWIANAFGFTPNHAQYFMMAIVLAQLIPVLITPTFIDRSKCRPLFLSLALIMIIFNIIFVVTIECYYAYQFQLFAYISAVALVFNQLVFLFGITPIGFILCSVVTPQEVRSKCVSICYALYYIACFVQVFGFPLIFDLIGSYTILVMAVIPSSLLLIYLYKNMPETKGLPVSQIIEKWIDKSDLELELLKK